MDLEGRDWNHFNTMDFSHDENMLHIIEAEALLYDNVDSNTKKWLFGSEDSSYNSIIWSCCSWFETWSSTKSLENYLLKGITSLESTSSSIFVMIMIRDYLFLNFSGICDYNFFSFCSLCAFSLSTSFPHLSLCSNAHFLHHHVESIVLCCLSISTSSISCALLNTTFSSILGEIMASVIGEEYY